MLAAIAGLILPGVVQHKVRAWSSGWTEEALLLCASPT
jgi:hypothetical protein